MIINGVRIETRSVRILGGLEIMKGLVSHDHIQVEPAKNILSRSYAGEAKKVTETTSTLKDEVKPLEPKNVLYPFVIKVRAENPTGSGATLYYQVRLAFHDGSEEPLEPERSVAEGSSEERTYLSSDIALSFRDGLGLIAARLYAYCSAAPAEGYEPTVALSSVRGVIF